MSCDCWCSVALPRVAVGWSAVCDSGIFLSYPLAFIKWALSRENLSSELPTKLVSSQSPQLQRMARNCNFTCSKFTYDTFRKANNKGAACVVRKPPKTGFPAPRPK